MRCADFLAAVPVQLRIARYEDDRQTLWLRRRVTQPKPLNSVPANVSSLGIRHGKLCSCATGAAGDRFHSGADLRWTASTAPRAARRQSCRRAASRSAATPPRHCPRLVGRRQPRGDAHPFNAYRRRYKLSGRRPIRPVYSIRAAEPSVGETS